MLILEVRQTFSSLLVFKNIRSNAYLNTVHSHLPLTIFFQLKEQGTIAWEMGNGKIIENKLHICSILGLLCQVLQNWLSLPIFECNQFIATCNKIITTQGKSTAGRDKK